MLPLFSLFLVLSGIASLTYQVTWVRLLGLSMGSTSASVSTVLAAFFLGMALGSLGAKWVTRKGVDRLRPYLVLEALIGIFGLLLLPVLLHLDAVMAMAPAVGGTLWAKFLVALVLLTVPAMCIGATFPVAAALLIRRREDVGLSLGRLYAVNTFGAVLGAYLSGFVFIPAVGIDGAIFVAVALNAAIVAIGVLWGRRVTFPDAPAPENARAHAVASLTFHGRALVVLFLTGFVSIAVEVGWTKYLSIFTGTTIYGFASILTVFLIGIAAGSWAIHRHLASIRRPEIWMALGLLLLGAALLLTRAGLSLVPNVYAAINALVAPDAVIHALKYAWVFALLILPTFLFGALFPLNLAMYCGGVEGVRTRVGEAYAVNTVASIAGSVAAGFWVIPEWGTDTLLSACALVIVVAPVLFIPTVRTRAAQVVFAVLIAGIFAAHWVVPHLDYQALIASVGYRYDADVREGRKPNFLFLKEGRAGVISVVSYDGKNAKVQNNGLNESVLDIEDRSRGLVVEQLLGLIPYCLHDDPKSAFVVGFGGGVTTRALTFTGLQSIHVVELEPAVIEAGRAIVKGEMPELKDPRVRLDINDARNTLLLEPTRYDIIVSQPSHSWLAGAANVFTKEFFEIAKSRLNEGGIYGQWVNLFNMDTATLQAIFKAFYTVFPEGVTFGNIPTGDFLLFGTDHPLVFDYDKITARMDRPQIKKAMKHYEVYRAEDLIWYFGLSRREVLEATRDSPMNQDTNILSEVRLSALVAAPEGDASPYTFLDRTFKFDLAPYLKPEEASRRMYDAGLYFLNWDAPEIAQRVADQLRGRDDMLARALDYEVLWDAEKYDEASALYLKHEAWPDRVHRMQVRLDAELKKFSDAERAVRQISNSVQRRAAHAQLLFLRQDWKALAQLKPESVEERKWHLLGVAQSNVKQAGAELLRLDIDRESDVPVLRALVAFYSEERNVSDLDRYSRLLVGALDKQTARLTKWAKRAIDDHDVKRARRLLDKVESMHSDAATLGELRAELANLVGT